MAKSSHILEQARTRRRVDAYRRWLKLKIDSEYLTESEKIRTLKETACQAEDLARNTYVKFKRLLNGPHGRERSIAEKKCLEKERLARSAERALSEEEEKICEKFNIAQWWPPEAGLSMEDALFVCGSPSPVQVIMPSLEKQMDLNAESDKQMRRELELKGKAVEPPRRYTMVDKDGWLTIKVNLNLGVPLEELELAIGGLLRQHRHIPTTGRNRPDKDSEALEAWDCYDRERRFSLVAERLGRKVSTVKGQYVRGCILISGRKPSGTVKQRRAGTINNPSLWFQTHYASCSRCQKADVAEGMCAAAVAYVTQDDKTLRERLGKT